jgi:hypothetical protein
MSILSYCGEANFPEKINLILLIIEVRMRPRTLEIMNCMIEETDFSTEIEEFIIKISARWTLDVTLPP